MKLLLVDDDAFLRDMYEMKFVESGHEVSAAENGAQALRILEEQKDFEVVLLDMIMPGMSGVELIQAIKEIPELADTLCIVLSNQGQEADVQEAADAGAVGYVIKAETIPSEVVEKIEKIYNSKKK